MQEQQLVYGIVVWVNHQPFTSSESELMSVSWMAFFGLTTARLDCEQSLFFSSVLNPLQWERRSRETRETRAAAREEKERLPAQPEPMKYA